METIQKIEQLFEEIQKDPNWPTDDFFDLIWVNTSHLPKAEIRTLMDEVYDWAKEHEQNQPHFFAMATFCNAGVYHVFDNFIEAMRYANISQKLFEDINDDDGVAISKVGIGFSYRSMGEIQPAFKYCLDGLDQLTKTGKFKVWQIIGLYCIGGIYAETNHADEALGMFQRGLVIADAVDKLFFKARFLNGIAGIYMRQKKYGMALEKYQEALDLNYDNNDRSRSLTDLGDYYCKMGDYKKALEYNEQALALRNEMKIVNGAVTNMMNIGEISVKMAKLNDAVTIYESALKLAEGMQVKSKMYQIHYALSDIYLSLDNLSNSMAHLIAYQQIREDVNHEDMERKVKNQQQLFEAELTQKENAIIKAQKLEIEHKNHQLEETIEELTITKISRRAKAITLFIAVALIIIEGVINHFVVSRYAHDNFFISLAAEGAIVLMLKPIEKAVEHYLLSNVIKKKRARQALETSLA